ncbi:hypothetical protein A3I51_03620 [Candidatus Gottesmanbacteria bacterium RIFCSPLOWO2_02_FULL_38_8]|nr:MAG: hypothetical protein A3I51_03620 [Candidatus Gottesmanbacteria bacterium RIFCSPLOWO2_02_FULL_38_8]
MNWDVAKIYFWEKRFWKKARRVIAMSQSDKELMMERVTDLKVDLVPNGVDTEFFSFREKPRTGQVKTILFVGNFKWLQNREAVTFLVEKVWPQIRQELGQKVRLWIVGKHLPPNIVSSAKDQITLSDDINDIRLAYRKSDVLLAPIYGPGGTRYKILESMATGVPVVTTTTGIEGLDAQNFRDAVIADDAQNLAALTVKVLTDKNLYHNLAENGRTLVENKFSWKTIAQKLDSIYQKAV